MTDRGRVGLATAGFVLLALAFALGAPVGSAPDESGHLTRGAAVVRGEILGEPHSFVMADGYRGAFDVVTVPTGYALLRLQIDCTRGRPDVDASCAPPLEPSDGDGPANTTAGRYPPFWYVPIGLPSLVADVSGATYGARVVSAVMSGALFALAFAVALRRSGPGRRGWLVAGVLASTTPAALWLAGTANPSGTEVAAATGFWLACLLACASGPGQGVAGLLAASGVALALSRPSGPVWVAGIVVASLLALGGRPALRSVRHDRHLVIAGLVVTAAVGLAVAWTVLTDTAAGLGGLPFEASAADTARRSWSLTPARILGIVGYFGWLDTPLGTVPALAAAAVPVLLAVRALPAAGWRAGLVLVAVAVGILAVPVLAEVAMRDRVGIFWQGRYTLPVAVGLPMLAAVALHEHRATPPTWVVPGTALVVATTGLVGLVTVVHRYAVGTARPVLDAFSDPAWQPPVTTAGALALGLAGAASLLAGVAWPSHGRVDADPTPARSTLGPPVG